MTEEASPPAGTDERQRLLDQSLRIQDLERAIEILRYQRSELLVEVRTLRAQPFVPFTPRRAIRWGLEQLLPGRARRTPSAIAVPPESGLPLSALPVVATDPAPRWEPSLALPGGARPATSVEPPHTLSWDLDLPAGCLIRGGVALRPGAWLEHHGGVEFVARLLGAGGAPLASTVVGIELELHAAQHGWIEWTLSAAAGGRCRLAVTLQAPTDEARAFAWFCLGDPRIEVPGLVPRPRLDGARVDAVRSDRRTSRARSRGGEPRSPVVSFLMPVHDPAPGILDRTIASVGAQTLDAWELCIVDDGSTDPLVRDRLARAAQHGRVRLIRHDEARGISAATNAALTLATAPFVATLDHDDLLAPDAVARIAEAVRAEPGVDVLYSDNDLISHERRFSAALKPDWSPDLMRSVMYTLHLGVYRRALVESIGGWRTAFDGAQDHDLVLRLSETTDRIHHLPRLLYHWRAHPSSASLSDGAKPLASERGRQAVAEHLQRIGQPAARVESLPSAGRYRVRWPRTRPMTVVMPWLIGEDEGATAAGHQPALLDGLLATLGPSDRVLLVTAGAKGAAGPSDERVTVVAVGSPSVTPPSSPVDVGAPGPARVLEPSLASVLSEAARHVGGTDGTVVILEATMAPTTPDALDELAGLVESGAGAAGGVVAAPSGRLVCGGMAFPDGLPIPLHPDVDLDAELLHPDLTIASNRLAVRGAVALPAAGVAEAVAALPESVDRLSLVALSLAAAESGDRVVWSPHARFEAAGDGAAELLRSPVAEIVALDRGARPDPFWNVQRWPGRGDATVPEALHENPLLDLVEP